MPEIDDADELAEQREIGKLTGHIAVRCPTCQGCFMTSIVTTGGTGRWTKSGGGWPKCKLCRAASVTEPVGDVSEVRRLPPPGKRLDVLIARQPKQVQP